jgi:hypothetical protein
MKKSVYFGHSASKGAALMIVLAFVVLLTGLALAYFTRTTTDRQLAQSSYNDTSADLLARSALDIVVNDFKQDIINNPTVTTANIQPTRYGDASIPNLIRRSFSGDPTNRTSGVHSTDPSANGRSISRARWNSHYLIPRLNTGTEIDSTPVASFIAPDWVLVTAQGPNSAPAPGAVIGRYAFAAYDEGGLLDMSLAGFPSWLGNPSGNCNPGPTPWLVNVGRKGTVGFADLTAFPYSFPQSDNVVGWRNYATTQRSGASFGSFNYSTEADCTKQDSYGSYLLDFGDPPFTFDTTDQPVPISSYPFTSVATDISNVRTDQAFVTRQELLKLRSSLQFTQNVLQYMGTFSRERNRPAPDWPSLQNNLTEGRFCFDNLDLVKPNPDNQCAPHPNRGRGGNKGQGWWHGRGHLCGTAEQIVNLFGLLWVPSTANADGTFTPGHWKYIAHNGPMHDAAPPALGHIPCWRGPNRQNDFFQILNYALNRLACLSGQQQGSIARTFAIGASLIDQYDSDSDDLDLSVPSQYQTHTTVIEYSPGLFAYGMEPTFNGNPNSFGDCRAGDTTGNCRNHSHRSSGAPDPVAGTIVINHAFSSVGDLGYGIVTSDASQPTLKFSSALGPTNPDPAALDFFGYNPVSSSYPRTGIVNLNTKNWPVLAAIIKGALSQDGTTNYVTTAAIVAARDYIVPETTARPALTRADVARLAEVAGAQIGATEEQKETIARALAEVGQTRTWNLFIDVIAQTGRYAPGTTNITDANKFTVEGEKRYWLHIALGRDLVDSSGAPCTGSGCQVDVLGTQLEEALE